MPGMISLSEWAQNGFGSSVPARNARARMIVPPAVKVGWHWLVDKKARFVGEMARLVLPPDDYLKGLSKMAVIPGTHDISFLIFIANKISAPFILPGNLCIP